MDYSLEKCSLYDKYTVNSKKIYVFDDHNMALPVWGTYASLIGPLHLITFDKHTDTHMAFNKIMRKNGKTSDYDFKKMLKNEIVRKTIQGLRLKQSDFCFKDVFMYSKGIYNTEQILTGVAFGYLLSYTVRCHQTKERLISLEENDCEYGYDACYIGDDDERKPNIREPLILDIDLDYFRSPKDINDDFKEYIYPYFENAVAVSIAREPSFFNESRIDKNFTSEEALGLLLDTLKEL